jgi:formate dehydrogenase iron-sulfur subunit
MSLNAFLVDTTKCIGCRACQAACKKWNGLPGESAALSGEEYTSPRKLSARTWTRVRFGAFDGKSASGWSIIHEKCNHCASPECLKACPEKAIFKQDGWTIIDQERCIGCGACETACPYGAVHVLREKAAGMKEHKAYKCHGCVPTGRRRPACSDACPTGALVYGLRIRLIKQGLNRVKALAKRFPGATLSGLESSGGLNVLTVCKDSSAAQSVKTGASERFSGRTLAYFCLRPMTLGIGSLKRKAWRIASSLTERDEA